jgi:DNA-binding transcriptional ArsR family regulator
MLALYEPVYFHYSRIMDRFAALQAFAALGQPTRLDVFRLLIQAGPDGRGAGEIGEALNVRPNTLSANLAVLRNAGLIRSAREGRNIRYHAHIPGVRGLLAYLMQDCCGGRADLCQPLIASVTGQQTGIS